MVTSTDGVHRNGVGSIITNAPFLIWVAPVTIISCSVELALQNYSKNMIFFLDALCRKKPYLKNDTFSGITNRQTDPEERVLIGIEFVADKEKKTPFVPSEGVTSTIVSSAFEKGLLMMPGWQGTVDGIKSGHIAIGPPSTVTESETIQNFEVLIETILEVS
ncbi:hypothetical protein CMK14_28280 [Candidatus Poribacteria bacterium]|nr:hypothetical protein [Candidatus Poribacteria bacterium]